MVCTRREAIEVKSLPNAAGFLADFHQSALHRIGGAKEVFDQCGKVVADSNHYNNHDNGQNSKQMERIHDDL
jgi:hypothetical protein